MKKRRFAVVALICCLSAGTLPAAANTIKAVSMNQLVDSERLWEITSAEIARKHPEIFKPTDKTNCRWRYGIENPEKIGYAKYQVCELLIDFTDDRVSELTVWLYNRGDAGVVKLDFFERMVAEITEHLQQRAQDVQPVRQQLQLSGGGIQHSLTWKTPRADLQLRYASTDKPEFCVVTVYPPGQAPNDIRAALKPKAAYRNLKDNLQTDASGNRFLMLPMVDQGSKGYCVAAVLERVMSYYGADFDQHTVAQFAESNARSGTSLETMLDRLESMKGRLNLRITTFYRFYAFENDRQDMMRYQDLKRFVEDYNRAAVRMRQKEIGKNGYIDFSDFVYPCFVAGRLGDRAGRQKFFNSIRQSINQGVPLCWAVLLLPDSPEKVGAGYHLRIINGFSRDGKNIIYTDSWGKGHEKKTMSADAAFGITLRLFSVAPALK